MWSSNSRDWLKSCQHTEHDGFRLSCDGASLAVGVLGIPYLLSGDVAQYGERLGSRSYYALLLVQRRNRKFLCGNAFKSFPALNGAIPREIRARSAVLDGEIVCLDRDDVEEDSQPQLQSVGRARGIVRTRARGDPDAHGSEATLTVQAPFWQS